MSIHVDLGDDAAVDALIEYNKQLAKNGLRGSDVDVTITSINGKPVVLEGE